VSDGRNEPCRCGSGKKYKKCCLPLDQTVRAERAKAEREAEEAPPLKDAVEAFTWAEGHLVAEGLSPWGAAVAAAVEAVDFYWDEKLAAEPEGCSSPWWISRRSSKTSVWSWESTTTCSTRS
jgi:hypothetical protein